jgi:hypothetical protein
MPKTTNTDTEPASINNNVPTANPRVKTEVGALIHV